MDRVVDLDVLRPDKIIVKLAGKEIDVSFIPSGITFDIDELLAALKDSATGEANLREKTKGQLPSAEETAKLRAYQEQTYDLAIKICSTFCKVKHQDMTESWFRENMTANQLGGFVSAVRDTLLKSYAAVNEYSKN